MLVYDIHNSMLSTLNKEFYKENNMNSSVVKILCVNQRVVYIEHSDEYKKTVLCTGCPNKHG